MIQTSKVGKGKTSDKVQMFRGVNVNESESPCDGLCATGEVRRVSKGSNNVAQKVLKNCQ